MEVEGTQLSMCRTKLIVLATCLYRVQNGELIQPFYYYYYYCRAHYFEPGQSKELWGLPCNGARKEDMLAPSTGIGVRIDPTLFYYVSGTKTTIAGASFIYRTNLIYCTNEDAV